MNYEITIDYKDLTFSLHLSLPPKVSVVSNDVGKDQQSATPGTETGFYLSTTVQVGYEEHELIEGRATFHTDKIEASLTANGVELINERIATKEIR